MSAVVAASTDNLIVELSVLTFIVGLPEPSPLPIPIPAKESATEELTILLVAQTPSPVRTARPVVERPSSPARSLARAKVNVPVEVIGPPVIVRPAAGCVAATSVTVPEPLVVGAQAEPFQAIT
jgi:hypothetical protein